MAVDLPQECQNGNSVLKACDARIKITLMFVYLLTTALLPIGAWAVYLLLAGILGIIILLSGLPYGQIFKRSFVLEVPIALILIPQLFLRTGICLDIPLVWGWVIPLSITALVRVVNLLLRSWLSIQLAVVITSATPFEEMLSGMRQLGLPELLTSIFALMWRYIFLFRDEVVRMQRAREARSSIDPLGKRGFGRALIWRAGVTGKMAGSLLLRSMERSQRIYFAMLSRGYDGRVRTCEAGPLLPGQRLMMISFLAVGLILIYIAWGLGA